MFYAYSYTTLTIFKSFLFFFEEPRNSLKVSFYNLAHQHVQTTK